MPVWAIVLTITFSGVVAFATIVSLLRSFRLATKDDIHRLSEQIRDMNQRMDRHLEKHP